MENYEITGQHLVLFKHHVFVVVELVPVKLFADNLRYFLIHPVLYFEDVDWET